MRTKSLFFLLLAILFEVYGQKQEKIYYDQQWKVVPLSLDAKHFRLLTFDKRHQPVGKVRTYYMDGTLEWEGRMTAFDPFDGSKFVPEGLCHWYYPTGKLSKEAVYENQKYNGLVTTWYKNGQKEKEANYLFGKPEGKWIQYRENGTVLREMEFLNGKPLLWEKWCDEQQNCQKVFSEEFKSLESTHDEWPVLHHTEYDKRLYKISLVPGKGLYLENRKGESLAQWISLPMESNTFSFEIKATLVQGDPHSGYGIFWDFRDWSNYRYFCVTASGNYQIGSMQEGRSSSTPWKFSPLIHSSSSNLLSIKKINDKVYFCINNEWVENQPFQRMYSTNVGFITSGGNKTVLFESLLVKQNENEVPRPAYQSPLPVEPDPEPQIVLPTPKIITDNEVDHSIPVGLVRENALGIVLGIEQYKNTGKVSYADKDAETMKRYFVSTLGIPEDRLYFKTDQNVTKAEFDKLFGRGGWLDKRCDSTTEVFIYFSGHGVSSEENKAFLMPYDGDPNYIALSAYEVGSLYQQLNRLKAKHITVMLDACFVGQDRETHPLLANVRSIGIRPKMDHALGRITLLTASGPTQASVAWPEMGHGLFTYYLLKGMQGAADMNKDHKITVEELQSYTKEKVSRQAGFLDREQTPTAQSTEMGYVISQGW